MLMLNQIDVGSTFWRSCMSCGALGVALPLLGFSPGFPQ
jgi:hypothetical protein